MHVAANLFFTISVVFATAAPPPPDPNKRMPKYTINLDLEPEERFVEVVQDHSRYIKELVVIMKGLFYVVPGKVTTDAMVESFKKGLVEENSREIQGMAKAIGVDYNDALMANLFYEINSVGGWLLLANSCTSMVAQNSNGTMFLARNMDYPPPFAPLQFDATFVQGGKSKYEGTMFAGVIGIMTGITSNGFAVSINARSKFPPTLEVAQKALESGAEIFHLITRRALESGMDFEGAIKFFKETPMVTGGYLTVAGAKPGQGCVVTTNTSALDNDVWYLKDGFGGGSGKENWFLVETNTDHWEKPAWLDGRRDFAKKDMLAIGQDDISTLRMYEVLSTGRRGLRIKVPVYNFATIQTDLACPATGEFQAYNRHCWDWSFSGLCKSESDDLIV